MVANPCRFVQVFACGTEHGNRLLTLFAERGLGVFFQLLHVMSVLAEVVYKRCRLRSLTHQFRSVSCFLSSGTTG